MPLRKGRNQVDGQTRRDTVWPLDVSIILLSAFVLYLVFTKLRFDDPRLIYSGRFYLLAVPLAALALSIMLRGIASRHVQKSAQIGFLLSVALHLLLLLVAVQWVIFRRYHVESSTAVSRERETIRRTIPEYLFQKPREPRQPPEWSRPVAAETVSRSLPEPLRQRVPAAETFRQPSPPTATLPSDEMADAAPPGPEASMRRSGSAGDASVPMPADRAAARSRARAEQGTSGTAATSEPEPLAVAPPEDLISAEPRERSWEGRPSPSVDPSPSVGPSSPPRPPLPGPVKSAGPVMSSDAEPAVAPPVAELAAARASADAVSAAPTVRDTPRAGVFAPAAPGILGGRPRPSRMPSPAGQPPDRPTVAIARQDPIAERLLSPRDPPLSRSEDVAATGALGHRSRVTPAPPPDDLASVTSPWPLPDGGDRGGVRSSSGQAPMQPRIAAAGSGRQADRRGRMPAMGSLPPSATAAPGDLAADLSPGTGDPPGSRGEDGGVSGIGPPNPDGGARSDGGGTSDGGARSDPLTAAFPERPFENLRVSRSGRGSGPATGLGPPGLPSGLEDRGEFGLAEGIARSDSAAANAGKGDTIRGDTITGRAAAIPDLPRVASLRGGARRAKLSPDRPPVPAGAEAVPAEPFRQRTQRTEGGDASAAAEPPGPATEEAIERGLAYLASRQNADGSWSLQGHGEPVLLRSDTAATGLSLLAFQGAGYTHRRHQYAANVARGLRWLTDRQRTNGDLFVPIDNNSNQSVALYSHGIAALALSEAYGMTQDPELRRPAQRAIDYIEATQHRTLGGWRYTPQVSADTSVSGWMMMALKSGELAGLRVDPETYRGIDRWLAAAKAGSPAGDRYRYNPFAPDTPSQSHGREPTPTMTAVGMLMRMYGGWRPDHPALRSGADYLLRFPPVDDEAPAPGRDTYYWYYATQVLFQMGGDHWRRWSGELTPVLLRSQVRGGENAGSWDPRSPAADRWSPHAGRLYLTTMNLLNLEVHYRHLPIYGEEVTRRR